MTGATVRLRSTRGPEPFALVLGHGAHVDEVHVRTAQRTLDERSVSADLLVQLSEGVVASGRLCGEVAPRMTLGAPGVPRAVQDPDVGMAAELHQPEAHGRCVPIEDDRRLWSYPRAGKQPF